MQKVQTIDLRLVKDRKFFIESYELLGFHAIVEGDELSLFWGKPEKRKKKEEDEEKRPERRSKTERRLGKKFYTSE